MGIYSNINLDLGKYLDTVPTLTDLRTFSTRRLDDGDAIMVTAKVAVGDTNGGIYAWSEKSVADDDNANVIRPTSIAITGRGRWILAVGKGNIGNTGPIGPVGPPGANVSDIGTFSAAKASNLAVTNPSTTTVRLSDRGKAVFERDTGLYGDLLTKYADSENIWWYRDAGNTRWIIAGDRISIWAAGAVPSKTADNANIIQKCLDFGALSARVVYVPPASWGYASTLTIRGKTGLVGEPGASILYCTTRNTGAIIMTGNGPQLYGITRLHYLPRPLKSSDRVSFDEADGIYCQGAINFSVSYCRTEGPQAASMMIRGCQYGVITNNWFESSLADSIHVTAAGPGDIPIYNPDGTYLQNNQITVPCYRLLITNNTVNNSGDDNIAIVSYVNHEVTQPTTEPARSYPGYFTEFTVVGQNRKYSGLNRAINVVGNNTYGGDARGITVVGGRDINIIGNYVEDSVVAGLLAYGEEFYNTYGVSNINVQNNMLVSTGNDGSYRPLRYDAYGNVMRNDNNTADLTRNPVGSSTASMIISGRSAAYPSDNVVVKNNSFYNCRQRGVSVQSNCTNLDISGNTVMKTVGSAIYLDGVFNCRVDSNNISETSGEALVLIGSSATGTITMNANRLHNIGSNQAGQDAIHLEGGLNTGIVRFEISNNSITGPQKYERFIEAFVDNIICENNTGLGEVGLGSTPNNLKQRVRAAATTTVATSANNAGAAPTALTQAVSQTDYNTLVTQVNTMKNAYNDLLVKLYNAGLNR